VRLCADLNAKINEYGGEEEVFQHSIDSLLSNEKKKSNSLNELVKIVGSFHFE